MTETQECKFSNVEEWHTEMIKFVHYLAGRNPGLAVEYDDIVGELMLELVKGVQSYPELPHEQLKAVLRRMMDNRISELKYRFHVTHRKQALFDISLSLDISIRDAKKLGAGHCEGEGAIPVEELIAGGDDPAEIFESKERVRAVRKQLSPISKSVFDSLILGNSMLAQVVWLSSMRASVVFGSRAVKVRPWHIADALHMDEKEVKIALKDIKRAYQEVINV